MTARWGTPRYPRYMQAYDARARKRREDLVLVFQVLVGLAILFFASWVPGAMGS